MKKRSHASGAGKRINYLLSELNGAKVFVNYFESVGTITHVHAHTRSHSR